MKKLGLVLLIIFTLTSPIHAAPYYDCYDTYAELTATDGSPAPFLYPQADVNNDDITNSLDAGAIFTAW